MALKKARGFNRGKSYDDLRQIAGGASVVPLGPGNAGIYAFPGRGTPWTNTAPGSIQRAYGYLANNRYPAADSSDGSMYVSYVEDLGALSDYYASGGFCVSMKVRYQPQAWEALGSDGTNFICANTAASSSVSTDLLNYTTVANTVVGQNVGYASGRVQYVNGTIIGSTGSQYITQGTGPGGTWTTLTSGAAQSTMVFVGAVFHNGQYYLYGWNNGLGGAILRTATWSLNAGTMVYNTGSTLNAVEHMDWFEDVGCFLAACTRNRASSQAQAGVVRSVDGTTWTDAFIGGLTTGLLGVATNGSGTAVAVGYGGFIAVSTDGAGSTWTPVTSGTTERFTSVKWYNGEFVAVTQGGSTSTSPDGLTWTFTVAAQNLYFAGGVGMELFIHSDGLYSYLRGINVQMVVQKYLGNRQWETITCIYTSTTNTVSGATVPAGVFFGNPLTGAYITTSSNMSGVHMTQTGAYVVDSTSTNVWAYGAQASAAIDYDWHRVSIVGTAVPGQATPTFKFQVYYDGNPVTTNAANRVAGTTLQRLYVCTSAASWNMACDIVATDFSGTRNVGLTNDMQIRPYRMTTDVQAEWDKLPPTSPTNASAIQGNGSILYSTSSVQSSLVGSEDQYAGAPVATVPGYRISAIQATTTFQRVGLTNPTVELSVVEGGSSLPVKSATLTGSSTENVTLTALYQTKLDGGSWTPETVSDATVQIRQSA